MLLFLPLLLYSDFIHFLHFLLHYSPLISSLPFSFLFLFVFIPLIIFPSLCSFCSTPYWRSCGKWSYPKTDPGSTSWCTGARQRDRDVVSSGTCWIRESRNDRVIPSPGWVVRASLEIKFHVSLVGCLQQPYRSSLFQNQFMLNMSLSHYVWNQCLY
jgi:hypothetical protein